MAISKKTFRFLVDLQHNNNRNWFNENKPRFVDAVSDFTIYLDDVIREVAKFDSSLEGVQGKECLFRIYRDVRFSTDKSPYKPNFGAYIAKGGRKSSHPGYYVHLDPFQSFLAGGKYMPEANELLRLRSKIADHSTTFLTIIAEPKFKSVFGEMSRDFSLKTAPNGFPKDHEALQILKLKSFTVSRKCSEKQIGDLRFVSETFRVMKPFLDFFRV